MTTTPDDAEGIYEVESRGRIRYRFRIDVNKPGEPRKQKMVTCDSLDQAVAKRLRIRAEIAEGSHVRRDGAVTVESYLLGWLELHSGEWSQGTADVYRRNLNHVIRMHGTKALYDLTKSDVTKVRDAMRSGKSRVSGSGPLAVTTINLTLTILSQALDEAEADGLVVRNVAAPKQVKRLREQGRKRRIRESRGSWRARHGAAFASHVNSHRLQAAFVLSLLGLRRGEVLGLMWNRDIDLDGEALWSEDFGGRACLRVIEARKKQRGGVRNGTLKTDASERVIPLPAYAVGVLRRWQRVQKAEELASEPGRWKTEGHVFTDATGKGLHPDFYSDLWDREVRAVAGLPRVPLHGARHWCTSRLDEIAPAGAGKAWVGHSDSSVTDGYTHASPEALIAVADKLGELLDPPGIGRLVAVGV